MLFSRDGDSPASPPTPPPQKPASHAARIRVLSARLQHLSDDLAHTRRRNHSDVESRLHDVERQLADLKDGISRELRSLATSMGTRQAAEEKRREAGDARLQVKVDQLADELALERSRREALEVQVSDLVREVAKSRVERSQAAALTSLQAEVGRVTELVDSEGIAREKLSRKVDTDREQVLQLIEGVCARLEELYAERSDPS